MTLILAAVFFSGLLASKVLLVFGMRSMLDSIRTGRGTFLSHVLPLHQALAVFLFAGPLTGFPLTRKQATYPICPASARLHRAARHYRAVQLNSPDMAENSGEEAPAEIGRIQPRMPALIQPRPPWSPEDPQVLQPRATSTWGMVGSPWLSWAFCWL